MGLFGTRKKKAPVAVVTPVEPVVIVPMELMDKMFDRSAGRFCEVCNVHGSHHTDKHNDFARAVLSSITPVLHG